jgi:hypothetical protein
MHHFDHVHEAIGTAPKYAIGDTVVFVNDYGVNWGEKIVSAYEWNDVRGHTYQYEGTQTPWFHSSERSFFRPENTELIAEAMRVGRAAGITEYGEY